MGQEARPQWLGDVVEAVDRLLETAPDDELGAGQSDELRRVGAARPDPAHPGWVSVDVGHGPAWFDHLEDARLAPAAGSRTGSHRLLEAVWEGDVIHVRAGVHVGEEDLFLWCRQAPPTRLIRALRDRLARMTDLGMAEHLQTGRLGPVPVVGPSPHLQAVAACCAPGLHLVWTPPGTGRAEVVAQALRDLLQRGRSVLLLSGAAASLDAVLQRAAAVLDPAPGLMVRVGTPHLRAVAEDARLSMRRLLRDRFPTLEREREDIWARILALQADPDLRRYEGARRRLAAFDGIVYDEARRRIAGRERLHELTRHLERLRSELAAGRSSLATAASERSRAQRAWDQLAATRATMAETDRLRTERDGVVAARDQVARSVLNLEQERASIAPELAAYRVLSRWRRMRERRHRRHLEGWRAEVEGSLRLARVRLADADLTLGELSRRIQACLDRVGSATAEEVERMQADLERTEAHVASARELERQLEQALAATRRELDAVQRQPIPTDEDYRLVREADGAGLPELWRRLPRLQAEGAPKRAELERLAREHEQVLEQLHALGTRTEAELVAAAGVVATTAAALRASRAAYERKYDHVIVDQAAAVALPDLVCAVGRAGEGATLLGDFLQAGAADQAGATAPQEPHLERWLGQNCFTLLGVSDPDSARRTEGCVCLTEQRRFGPAVTSLANGAAYGGILRLAQDDLPDGTDGPEIVLVDVPRQHDGLVRVRGSGSRWWLAGGLAGCALARWHAAVLGQTVAVMALYEEQARLVEDLLLDCGDRAPQIQLGTPDRFLGREFDVAVLDLVEDGGGGLASEDAAGRPRSELRRAFNTGITRARRRLYLVASLAAVRRARSGPLAALRLMLQERAITTIPVRDLLGLHTAGQQVPASLGPPEKMHRQVRVIGLGDRQEAQRVLCAEIDDAVTSVCIFAPLLAARSPDLLPHLRDAVARGVDLAVATLPGREQRGHVAARMRELRAAVPNAVVLDIGHDRLAVIDARRTLLATSDGPARTGAAAELLLMVEGPRFARRMLRHTGAAALRTPPRCRRCGKQALQAIAAPGSGWRWRCGNVDGGEICGWEGLLEEQT